MQPNRPGELIDHGALIREIDFAPFRMRVSTERYHSADYALREREALWLRVWQVAGRLSVSETMAVIGARNRGSDCR